MSAPSPVELDPTPSDAISSLQFSPSGSKILVGSWDCYVYVYQQHESSDTFTLQSRHEIPGPVLDVCWGKDEDQAFCVGLRKEVQVLALNDSNAEGRMVLSSHEAASNKVAYSKEHDLVISTSWDGIMHVHSLKHSGIYRVRLAAKPFALSLSAARVLVAMVERKLSVYELKRLAEPFEQRGAANDDGFVEIEPWQERESSLKFMTRAIQCMPDGTGFATSSIEGRVGVEWFDPELDAKKYAFKCHRQTTKTQDEDGQEQEVDIVYPVNALAFHPVHGTFATGGGDGVVAVWDAQTKRRVKQYPKLGASVAAMDFSPDGKLLAIGVSPGFEDGKEEEETDQSLVKVFVRKLAENEAKGKPPKA